MIGLGADFLYGGKIMSLKSELPSPGRAPICGDCTSHHLGVCMRVSFRGDCRDVSGAVSIVSPLERNADGEVGCEFHHPSIWLDTGDWDFWDLGAF